MKVASIDIGTNTALLLIANVVEGNIGELYEGRDVVRLGEGVDETGRISQSSIERLRAALLRYAGAIEKAGVEQIVVTGTSASRDASNGEDVIALVRDILKAEYQILSGDTEAILTFIAAKFSSDETVAVVDIGGGSTEIVIGSNDTDGPVINHAVSYNIGSVRLTERSISGYPVALSELEALSSNLRSIFSDLGKLKSGQRLVGIGGTATTTALVLRGLGPEQIAQDLEIVLSKDELENFRDELLGSSVDEIFAMNPSLMQGRSDVLGAGVLILCTIVQLTGASEVLVRFRGVRHASALIASSPSYRGSIAEFVKRSL